MSKPKLLGAYNKESETITVKNADYTEVCGWVDGNPDKEDRLGYFVSVDNSTPGRSVVIADSTANIRGVTIEDPGFSSNATDEMYKVDGSLLPEYAYVAFSGFATVIDNGRCEVNSRCVSDDDGTAKPSTNDYGYLVTERVDDDHVLVLIEPQGDAIQRLATSFIESTCSVENGVLKLY